MTPGRGECPLCGIEVSGVRDENDRFLPIRGAGHLDNCLYSKSMMGELEKTGPKRMRRVYLESPWAGDTVTNYAYAIRAMLDCLRRGEAPFASHIFYAHSGVLDDLVPAERALGIQAGLAWAEAADATVVYMDRGVSPGMQLSIDAAEKAGKPVERRWLRKSTEVIVHELEEFQFGWLKTALLKCGYREDVQALRHFVFHARLNGASNTCLLCLRSCDEDDEGHLADCPYFVALERVSAPGVETLVEWADRQ